MTAPMQRPARPREPRTPTTPAVASIDRTLTILARGRRKHDPDPQLDARIDGLLDARNRLIEEGK